MMCKKYVVDFFTNNVCNVCVCFHCSHKCILKANVCPYHVYVCVCMYVFVYLCICICIWVC